MHHFGFFFPGASLNSNCASTYKIFKNDYVPFVSGVCEIRPFIIQRVYFSAPLIFISTMQNEICAENCAAVRVALTKSETCFFLPVFIQCYACKRLELVLTYNEIRIVYELTCLLLRF